MHGRADLANLKIKKKPQGYGDHESNSNDEYSVIMSNKDDKHSDDDLNDMLKDVNGNKTPRKEKPVV